MSVEATRAVWKYSRTKGGARLVMLALADEANHQGYVTAYRRSQSHLADMTLLDEGTVRRGLKAAEQLGELEILARGDGRRPSDYRLILPDLAAPEGVQNAAPGVAPRAPSPRKSRAQGVQDATPITPLFPAPVPTVDPNEECAPITDDDIRAAKGFEDFWAAYPRKRSKGQARRAWAAAVRKVPARTIVDGARRFAADPELPEEGFVPYPATWLNGERWEDAPLDPRPAAHVDAFTDPVPRPAPRGCATSTCDGSGWLDDEFDPWEPAAARVPKPCPTCRPNHAAAATQGAT